MYTEKDHTYVCTNTHTTVWSTNTEYENVFLLAVCIACEPKVMCIIATEVGAGKKQEKDEVMKSINTNISFN